MMVSSSILYFPQTVRDEVLAPVLQFSCAAAAKLELTL